MRDHDLDALWLELERRRVVAERREPPEVQLARAREALIAAFGEADFAAATLGLGEEPAEKNDT